jgi:hypothetical protein
MGMSRKQFTTEKIIGMLREADVALPLGMLVRGICLNLGVTAINESGVKLYQARQAGKGKE